ncbi:hypothetical protein [Staphylococcus equorum]|uniref:Uncharacterized protein n=1 Tax=Staphylococcus equorum TaxID=246432 RepID=A0AAP7IGD1_9STAP|nr:hypothetical protein [Staphylococcus equorum]OEK58873.1 hypothetical protein ASS94_00700 [Staphylococcus equorum]
MKNSNDNRDMMDYDEAKKLRRDMLTIILFIVAVFIVVFVIVRFNQVNELKDEIKAKQEQKESVEAYNKDLEGKREQQLESVGLSEVKKDMETFNNLFFVWNTWGEYDKNMKELQQLFPKIDEDKKVDISGKDVGSGDSPKSSYDNDFYTTTNKNEIAEKVTQNKDGISSKSSTVWFIVGDKNDDDLFNISHMKRYRELSPN